MINQNSREESCRSIKTGNIIHLYYYIKFHSLLSELPLINVELGSLFAVSALFWCEMAIQALASDRTCNIQPHRGDKIGSETYIKSQTCILNSVII
jgi:hypothetical protein